MKHDRVTVRPFRLRGSITAPPSKSIAHRDLVCASLAEGTSTIDNIDLSEDIRATIACCESLGARIDISDGKAVVQGAGLPAENAGVTRRFGCNERGSTLRFMIPPALLLGSSAVFTGSRTLLSRPLSVYEDLFEKTGMVFPDQFIQFFDGHAADIDKRSATFVVFFSFCFVHSRLLKEPYGNRAVLF